MVFMDHFGSLDLIIIILGEIHSSASIFKLVITEKAMTSRPSGASRSFTMHN